MTIRSKLYGMTLLVTVGMAGALWLAISCLEEFRVNGPVYKGIIQDRDIVADVMPPPLYLVESFLIAHQIVHAQSPEKTAEFKRALLRLEARFDERHNYWRRELADSESIKPLLVDKSYEPAKAFYKTLNEKFLPAAQEGNWDVAREALDGPMSDYFDAHSKAVAQVEAAAKRRTMDAEGEAFRRASRWTGVLVFVSILSLLLMIGGLLWMSTSVVRASSLIARRVEEMASGDADLSSRLEVQSNDEMGRIAQGVNATMAKVQLVVQRVRTASAEMLGIGSRIATTAQDQQTTMTGLTASTSQIAAAVNEITATGRDLSRTMEEVSQRAKQTAALASARGRELSSINSNIRSLVESAAGISEKLSTIRDRADEITLMVTTITKVADQTNLLSVNAAIEAEKAGESGLGFLVVAREIRRLADQTAVATLNIESIVSQMHEAVSSGVAQMDHFTREVTEGVERVEEINRQTGQIVIEVQALDESFRTVNEGMQNQTTGAAQISQVMRQVAQSAEQTEARAQDFGEAAEKLRQAVESLNAEIARYKA